MIPYSAVWQIDCSFGIAFVPCLASLWSGVTAAFLIHFIGDSARQKSVKTLLACRAILPMAVKAQQIASGQIESVLGSILLQILRSLKLWYLNAAQGFSQVLAFYHWAVQSNSFCYCSWETLCCVIFV